MVAQVQKTSEGLAIVFSPEAAKELRLTEGASVEISTVADPEPGAKPKIVFATTTEAMAAYRRTLPKYAEVYRELAK